MNTYANVFGGENINPTNLDYKFYLLHVDIDLQWPFEALDGANVTASKIDVQADSGISIFMPDASLASQGEDVLWNNVGVHAFTVFDYDGNTIITVQPGTQWFIYLTDNTTPHGEWEIVQFGASTSSANAAALAGFGLRANINKLDQHLLTNPVGGDILLTSSSRAQVFRNTGGSVVHTFESAAVLGNGWFAIEINAGSGNVTLQPTPPDLIDGNPTKVLAPGESLTVYSFGSGFETMGYGRAITNTVTGTSIDVAGAGDITLTSPQVLAQVQNFTGTLTGPRTVQYGTGDGFWFVLNDTNGAFPLSFKGAPLDDPVTVLPHNFSILRSLGGALDIAFTATSGTVTSIATVENEITGGFPTPITSTGTIGLADTPVVPGVYGEAGKVPVLDIDAKGRTIAASEVDIAISFAQISNLATLLLPGTLVAYAGITVPVSTVWLPCDGTTRLKADFPNLWPVIDGVFGPSTGTTFTLPDTRGRVLAGADEGTGRLTAASTGFGAAAVLGAVGGTQSEQANLNIPSLFLRVGYWASPNQSSTAGASVSVSGTTDEADGPAAATTADGGTPGYARLSHYHAWRTTTGSISWNPAAFGAYGLSDAVNATGSTTAVTNVQPTLIIRHLIKT